MTFHEVLEFEGHVTIGLIHISQIGNKKLIYLHKFQQRKVLSVGKL